MRRRNVQEAKYNMYMNKRKGVQSVREQLREDLSRKEQFNQHDAHVKENQRESIRMMITKSKQSVDKYRHSKAEQSRQETKAKTEYEKKLIYRFEKEAQDLERMEENLIKRLQDIQEEEREAFMELEQSMITASLAKKDRLEIVNEVIDEQQSLEQQQDTNVIHAASNQEQAAQQ